MTRLPSGRPPAHRPPRSPDAQVAAATTWAAAGRFVVLVANLLATPLTIRLLGPTRYGLWTLFLLFSTWSTQTGLGMGPATTKFGAEYYAKGDARGESETIWSGITIVTVFTSGFAATVAVLAPSLLRDIAHVTSKSLATDTLALRVVCVALLLSVVATTVNTPQVVRQRGREVTAVTTLANLVTAIGIPLALFSLSGGLVVAASVTLAAALISVLANFLIGVRFQPVLRVPRLSGLLMRRLTRYGAALSLAGVVTVALSTGDRFLLANNHSTAVLAYYSVAANLAATLEVFPEQLVGPLMPGLAGLRAQRRLGQLRALYGKSLSGLFLSLTPAAILLAFVAHPFLSVWAGKEYGLHSTLPFLILIWGAWYSCLGWVPRTYLISSGRVQTIAYLELAEIAPYLLLAWVLTERFGAIGAAVVWTVRCIVESTTLAALVRRAAGLPLLSLPERRLRSIIAPLALGVVCIGTTSFAPGLAARAALAAFLGVAYAICAWQFLLTRNERRGLLDLANVSVRRNPRYQYRHARR